MQNQAWMPVLLERETIMDKKSKIREIFSNFVCKTFFEFGSSVDSFHCDKEFECKLNKDAEPIWSPAYGDDNATVMFVAEAPSPTGGKGPHLGGLFKDWALNQGEVIPFRNFFAKELGFMPYFTDLVKCGPKNAGDKRTIDERARRCVELFLLREIKEIGPDYIYCVGRRSYTWLKKYKLVNKSTGRLIELKPLIHYSVQAGLPLKSTDKELIWRWQLGRLAKNYVENIPLSSLSYFRSDK
jgi:uracil-DNA glycosylase